MKLQSDNENRVITDLRLSEHFTLGEMVYSEMAAKYGLKNVPGEEAVENLCFLVRGLLQILRDLYGKPIRVSSGFRSPELNRLVGGVYSSQHLTGEAADCVVDDPVELLRVLEKSDLCFDQAILYRKRHFLHLSLCRKGMNRKQILYR